MTEERRAKVESLIEKRQGGLTVIVEDVTNPHNIAAIIRSCDAFGVQSIQVVDSSGKWTDFLRVGRDSSSSANRWVDVIYHESIDACAETLHAEGYEIIATVLSEKTENIFEADLSGQIVAILIGNEHSGASERAKKLADRALMVPMRGMIQSLNVSVCAAICLFEIVRQRGNDERFVDLNLREKLTERFIPKEATR